MSPRLRPRLDGTHHAIADVAEAHGWEVVSLAQAGLGIPDLLLWHAAHGFRLVECKDRGGRLTEAQKSFRRRYRMPILELRSAYDAEQVLARGI